MQVDLAVIGGGPAGLAAAVAAREAGIEDIIILEREESLGGILNQCIHNGFGLHTFKEELTGPEYAGRYINKVMEAAIPYRLNTMVLSISPDKKIIASSGQGLLELEAKAVILAMGCRERPRGALNIPGGRPAGIYTAGTAQHFVNIKGYMPGKEVVILGSGDIGLIMARRMTLEGARVKAVIELMPYSGGLNRNIVQCLDDYGIPLRLSHTITEIIGKERVEAVKAARVDENRRPIYETEETISCDTLLLSVGLLPENELSKEAGVKLSPVTGGPLVGDNLQTNMEGVFACGNVLHVHDLVDFVSEESEQAGRNAAKYIQGSSRAGKGIEIEATGGIRYCVPASIDPVSMEESLSLRFRVGDVYQNSSIALYLDENRVINKKRPILTPGEMETLILKKEWFAKYPNTKKIILKLETKE